MMVSLISVHHTVNLMVVVKDIDHAIKEVRNCIDSYNIPSSDWIGGRVVNEQGKRIGTITYNGRYIPERPKATIKEALPNNCFIL